MYSKGSLCVCVGGCECFTLCLFLTFALGSGFTNFSFFKKIYLQMKYFCVVTFAFPHGGSVNSTKLNVA